VEPAIAGGEIRSGKTEEFHGMSFRGN
jgi:hypothetical protein